MMHSGMSSGDNAMGLSSQQHSAISHQFQKTSAGSYHPPLGGKQGAVPQQLGGTIHAPRHSQTKRSFGRDLINIQQNNDSTSTNNNSNNFIGVKNTIFNVAKVNSTHSLTLIQQPPNLKTRSYLSGSGTASSNLQTQASTIH